MSEVTDLVVIEKANAMTVFQSADQIEEILQKVEREVMSFVPDITTAKGRKEIASLAYKVAQTKTYLDGLGKDLVAELKEIPKLIDANRKTVRDRLDELKARARQPLTDYEEEQARIKAEEEAKAAAEALAKKIESDHEIAILMDREFDRQREEARLKAEQERRKHEERLKKKLKRKPEQKPKQRQKPKLKQQQGEKQKLRPQRNVQSVNALKQSNEHSAKQKRQQNELKEKNRRQLKKNAEKHRRRLNESGARLKQKSKPE